MNPAYTLAAATCIGLSLTACGANEGHSRDTPAPPGVSTADDVALPTGAPAPPDALRVEVHGLRSSEGKVGCAVFTSETGFPNDVKAAQQAAWCSLMGAVARCDFVDVPAGPCAVACFHDENDDGTVATGLYGVPLEGIAASNDALSIMGPPRFADARWDHDGGPALLQLHVTYNVAKQPQ